MVTRRNSGLLPRWGQASDADSVVGSGSTPDSQGGNSSKKQEPDNVETRTAISDAIPDVAPTPSGHGASEAGFGSGRDRMRHPLFQFQAGGHHRHRNLRTHC